MNSKEVQRKKKEKDMKQKIVMTSRKETYGEEGKIKNN
jgi:hypothetical protein